MASTASVRQVSTLSLIERVKTGDEQAFNELYTMHHQRVFTAVKRFISEPDIAEHVTNGVFARFWQVRNSPAAFKGGSSFTTWLTRIAYNEALMYLRKNRAERMNVAFSLDDSTSSARRDGGNTVEDGSSTRKIEFATRDLNLEGIFDRTALAYAISKVPAVYRIVFELRLIQNFSIEETCEALNLEVAVVKSRLFRSRRIVQGILREKFSPHWRPLPSAPSGSDSGRTKR